MRPCIMRLGKTASDRRSLPNVIERVGEDQILYASDYPYEPDLSEAIRNFAARRDISEVAKRKILSDNGKRFYNMEV